VLFYLRNKAYGFINPDDDPSKQIWVHRTSLDTPHSVEAFPTRPYLLKGESVKFRIEPGAPGKTDKAVDVRFANGRQVPLFRKNYHASVVRGEMQRLGERTFEILKQEGSAEEQLELLKQAAQQAEEQIALAADKQSKYGPELE
jgi:cold shock CspA family protein